MGNLGMIKVLIRGNTILMVLLAITYVSMEITAIGARNGVAYFNRSRRAIGGRNGVAGPNPPVRLRSAQGKEANSTFLYYP